MPRLGRAYPTTRIYRPRPKAAAAVAPAFDVVATGGGFGLAPSSWTHPAGAANRYVLAIVGTGVSAPTAVSCGGTSMTLLSPTLTDTNGNVCGLYTAGGIAATAQSMTVTGSGTYFCWSISYTGVHSASTVQTYVSPSTTSYTQAGTCSAGQRIVQIFEDINQGFLQSYSGGNSRALCVVSTLNVFTLSDATANTTFTATLSSADYGGGLAVILS
jgi:hypothetical protein